MDFLSQNLNQYKMNRIIIKGENHRYLSEIKAFSDCLPKGIINKKLTDVGGTYAAVNCKHNYIIVVPFRDLATSIQLDENNTYEVFKLYGGILKKQFTEYMEKYDVKKIAVTYDSFEKLIDWLEREGENLNDYKVLVDEYHLILEDMDFRDEAINKLLNNITRFNHYSFLSATPINSDFEFDFFKELPHYEVDWGKTSTIEPLRIKTPNVYKGTVSLIQEFQEGLMLDDINGNLKQVEELHIFMNSVKGIAQVCSTANIDPEDVRIICADNIRNGIILNKYKINSISDSNKAINFYTKKGFQGCNVFSNNALVVVVSDSKLAHTLIDIETTLTQIVGRIRLNDNYRNIFRHKIYHIYSTNKNIMSDEEFEEDMKNKREESLFIFKDLMSKDEEVRRVYLSRMNFEADFISKKGNEVYLNERKEQLFRYKFELRKVYKNGATIRDAYLGNKKFDNSLQRYSKFDDVLLSKIVNIKFEDIYKLFLESNEDEREPFSLEYPEFFEYEKYIKETEMSTLRWNKKKIDNLLTEKKLLNVAHKRVYKLLDNGFSSSADLKDLYGKVFKDLGITLTAKGTLVVDNPFISVEVTRKNIDGKYLRGYEINKLIYNLNI